VAGDPANVRAPDRDVEGSPATLQSPTGGVTASHAAGGSVTTLAGRAPARHNSITSNHVTRHRVECRAGASRCLTEVSPSTLV
jgi:hypothetical protein